MAIEQLTEATVPCHRVLVVVCEGDDPKRRPWKFVRYLREFGWEPMVITNVHVSAIPEDIKALQVGYPRLDTYQVGKPSRLAWRNRIRWVGSSIHQTLRVLRIALTAKRVAQQWDVHCVYTSSGADINHIVGWWVQKRLDVGWVAEISAPRLRRVPGRNVGRKLRDRFIRSELKQASVLVTETYQGRDELAKHYPTREVHVIPDGADPADFHIDVEPCMVSGHRAPPQKSIDVKREVCHLFCAGLLSDRRSPIRLLQAVSLLIRQQRLAPSQIHITLLAGNGVFDSSCRGLVCSLGLAQVVTLEQIPRTSLCDRIRSADALLFIGQIGRESGSGLPEELYEYVYAKRPILALVEEGEAAALVRQTRTGIVVAPNRIDSIAPALHAIVNQRDRLAGFDPQPLPFTCIEQTQRLAELLTRAATLVESLGWSSSDRVPSSSLQVQRSKQGSHDEYKELCQQTDWQLRN